MSWSNQLMSLSTGEGLDPGFVFAVVPGDLSPKVIMTTGIFFASLKDGESLSDGVKRVILEINNHLFGVNHLASLSTGEGFRPMAVTAIVPGDASPKVILNNVSFFAKVNDGESVIDGVKRVTKEINSHRSHFPFSEIPPGPHFGLTGNQNTPE